MKCFTKTVNLVLYNQGYNRENNITSPRTHIQLSGYQDQPTYIEERKQINDISFKGFGGNLCDSTDCMCIA